MKLEMCFFDWLEKPGLQRLPMERQWSPAVLSPKVEEFERGKERFFWRLRWIGLESPLVGLRLPAAQRLEAGHFPQREGELSACQRWIGLRMAGAGQWWSAAGLRLSGEVFGTGRQRIFSRLRKIGPRRLRRVR